jgi:ABC-type antimicrobial peptide transport system permease subunit
MTFGLLLRRNLRFHFRANLGVVLGAAVGAAALCGALVIGDSMRFSLRESALRRLGPAHFAMNTADRLVTVELPERIRQKVSSSRSSGGSSPIISALAMAGTAARQDGTARLNNVQVFGVDEEWVRSAGWLGRTNPASSAGTVLSTDTLLEWTNGSTVLLNEVAAQDLKARMGDDLVLRVRRIEALGLDAAISPRRDLSMALRLKAGPIVPSEKTGAFSLSSGRAPANVFLPLAFLQEKLGSSNQVNLILAGAIEVFQSGQSKDRDQDGVRTLDALVKNLWTLPDLQLHLREVPGAIELSTPRIFLDEPTTKAAIQVGETNAVRILTYLATLLRAGDKAAPYSMVTAADTYYLPPGTHDDEIVVNQWLADDLDVQPGSQLDLSYFVVDGGSRLLERTNRFKVCAIVPLSGIYADRTLMPDFPGVAKAESTHDWDAGFPLTYKIRDKDEAYWKEHRGTPKAFVTLAAGQQMWGNRFGNLTAIRYPIAAEQPAKTTITEAISQSLLTHLEPAQIGLTFLPVRSQALQSVGQSQDFGELFLGFSIFLVVSALLLVGLFFQLNLEHRAAELGTLLALGFTPGKLRRLLLIEGSILSAMGGMAGMAGGLAYAKAMLWALGTIWKTAVGSDHLLLFHFSAETILTGLSSSIIVSTLTIWFTLRRQVRQPITRLLAGAHGETPYRSKLFGGRIGVAALIFAGVLALWALMSGRRTDPEVFFGVGTLMLLGGLGLISHWLARAGVAKGASHFTLAELGSRGCGRRRKRSLATVALLASGSFIILAIGAFRQDANRDARSRSSGTGGFALIGETAVPILQDLNTQAGREAIGLDSDEFAGVRFISFRVRAGDEASCLNLNRAQHPRILGVDPSVLKSLKAFKFQKTWPAARGKDWSLLSESGPGAIPAIADANSIEWSLGKKLGQTVQDLDQRGAPLSFLLAGSLDNSVLQGSLVIAETNFTRLFPGISGYQYFLIDTPPGADIQAVSANLSRALQDYGMAVVTAPARLAEFNAVENTYLNAFQLLGGIGLLLGSAGLGLVVLRNVWERRAELGLLLAIGFEKSRVHRLILIEHGALLGIGLILGLVAAAVAVSPALFTPGMELPLRSLGWTLLAVLASGLAWTWIATQVALRGDLLKTLQKE